MTAEQKLLDLLWRIFHNVNDWLRFAEAKNGVVLVFSGAALGAVLPSASATQGVLDPVRIPVSLLFLASAIIALCSFVPVLTSKVRGSESEEAELINPLFFGALDRLSTKDFLKASIQCLRIERNPQSELAEHLAEQILANSRIAVAKFVFFRWAAYCLLAAFLLLATPLVYVAGEAIAKFLRGLC